tara:strand:+ start:321 stop:962 length:642 start_codon:yes stop_codon:yes gene_type:complete
MKLNVSLRDGNDKIVDDILKFMLPDLNRAFSAATGKAESKIKSILHDKITYDPVYGSLISGRLRYEFGIPRVSAINSIVEEIVDTVQVKAIKLKKTARKLTGGIDITLIDLGSNILQDKDAVVNDVERGYILPWLKWLLFDGSSPIVMDYHVEFGSFPGNRSRTGGAVMVPGGKWNIDTRFAGVASNNWLTRSVVRARSEIVSVISSELKRSL